MATKTTDPRVTDLSEQDVVYREVNPGRGDANPDPITGAPGSHPTGAGIGAASGAATGAALGALGGPPGAIIGAIAGGLVGGLIGKGVGEWVDPTDETYWRSEYRNRPYFNQLHDYDRDVEPAYRYGSNAADVTTKWQDVDDTVETGTEVPPPMPASATPMSTASSRTDWNRYDEEFRAGWDKVKEKSKLTYEQARAAIRDGYERRARIHEEGSATDSTRNKPEYADTNPPDMVEGKRDENWVSPKNPNG